MEAEVRRLTCRGEPSFCKKGCSKVHKRLQDNMFGPVIKQPELCEGIKIVDDGTGSCNNKAYIDTASHAISFCVLVALD